LENILISIHMKSNIGLKQTLFSTSAFPQSDTGQGGRDIGICKAKPHKKPTGEIAPHGNQRMLGVSMAWGAEPKVLLLDEPVTG